VGCECGLMAELGREMGTSSEKVEEIALVAVDGLFAMVTRQCLVVGSEGRSFGVSYLRRASRPFGEGEANAEGTGGFRRSTGQIASM
jgi:hypothetical protein